MHYQKDQSRQPQQLPSDPSQESHPKPQQSPSDPNQESDPKPQQSPSDPSQESDPKPQQSPGGSAIASSSPGTKSSKSQRSVKFDMSPSGSSFFDTVSSQLPQVLEESAFQMPTIYHGDSYPSEVTCGQTERLDKYYKVAKEEYYSKSGKKPVTPENFHRWKTTRGAKGPVHLCELFSGSARLSYVALLAGLSVAFPVDLRYGWNLGTTSHQEIDPKVIVMSPSFGTWTSQATNLSSEDKERHAAEEVSASQFVKLLAERQAQRGRAFVVEQPWSSPSWKHTCFATLASDIPGCKPRQRTDQCCFGAVDGGNSPLLKATGFQSNLSLRNATRRCQGHRLGHGQARAGDPRSMSQSTAGVYTYPLARPSSRTSRSTSRPTAGHLCNRPRKHGKLFDGPCSANCRGYSSSQAPGGVQRGRVEATKP